MTPPKILNLNSYHYRRGGADVVYLDHARLMAERGWETAFMAMHHPENLPCEWERFFVDELQHGHSYGALAKLKMAGKVIHSFEAQDKLRALLREFRPDVAHAHNLYHHLSPSVLPVLKEAGIPVVLTAHDLKLACPQHDMLAADGICERCKGGRFYNCVTQRCVKGSLALSALVAVESTVHAASGIYRRNLDRVIVPSRFYLQKLVEWGWSERQLVHIPNFVSCHSIRPDFEPGDYFLYFGRLAASKGLLTLIRAATEAGVKLVLAGSGDLEPEVRGAAENSAGKVEYAGRRSGEALFSLVRQARAVVLPSEWYENAPMSVLEAGALGTPAIGADIGGIPELVRQDETGWLFPSGDAAALSALLRRVADMPDDTLRLMGEAARRMVENEYSAERYVERMLALYGEIGVRLPQPASV